MPEAIAQMIMRTYKAPTGYNAESAILGMIAEGFRIGVAMAYSEIYKDCKQRYWR